MRSQTARRATYPTDVLERFHAAVAELALASREQLEVIVQAGIDTLDLLDIDADEREDECEDEGAQCDDEGVSGYEDPDREPSLASLSVLDQRQWSDHLDMSRTHFVDGELSIDDEGEDDHRTREDVRRAQQRARPSFSNVGEFMPVRSL